MKVSGFSSCISVYPYLHLSESFILSIRYVLSVCLSLSIYIFLVLLAYLLNSLIPCFCHNYLSPQLYLPPFPPSFLYLCLSGCVAYRCVSIFYLDVCLSISPYLSQVWWHWRGHTGRGDNKCHGER